jgi:hypothetical protein
MAVYQQFIAVSIGVINDIVHNGSMTFFYPIGIKKFSPADSNGNVRNTY